MAAATAHRPLGTGAIGDADLALPAHVPGSSPVGLTLSAAGLLSGVPTTVMSSSFTVTVTDANNATATGTLSITVAPALLLVTTASLPGGHVSSQYAQTLTATGGTGSYGWAVTGGALPEGLSLSSSGMLSGTPTTAAVASFTVTVTDADNMTATQTLSIVVAVAVLTVSTTSLPSGSILASYSATLTVMGGTGPYRWLVTDGSLPAWLSLSADGVLTGNPSVTTIFGFTVTVTDASNATATKCLTLSTQ